MVYRLHLFVFHACNIDALQVLTARGFTRNGNRATGKIFTCVLRVFDFRFFHPTKKTKSNTATQFLEISNLQLEKAFLTIIRKIEGNLFFYQL